MSPSAQPVPGTLRGAQARASRWWRRTCCGRTPAWSRACASTTRAAWGWCLGPTPPRCGAATAGARWTAVPVACSAAVAMCTPHVAAGAPGGACLFVRGLWAACAPRAARAGLPGGQRPEPHPAVARGARRAGPPGRPPAGAHGLVARPRHARCARPGEVHADTPGGRAHARARGARSRALQRVTSAPPAATWPAAARGKRSSAPLRNAAAPAHAGALTRLPSPRTPAARSWQALHRLQRARLPAGAPPPAAPTPHAAAAGGCRECT